MMPLDFIIGVGGFLAATFAGYLIYKIRRVSADLDHHALTVPLSAEQEPNRHRLSRDYARRRHPSVREWRRCPICADMYQGSIYDHLHKEAQP